jgi:molecular chaperone Hsp33
MEKKDYILRASAGDGAVRIFVADTRNTVQQAFEHHKTSPVISAALGRTMTGAAIMGLMLKGEKDMITVRIDCDGPAKGFMVTADAHGRVKGYPFEPVVDIPLAKNGKLDVQEAMGFGDITVIKDMGLKEPYCGTTPLLSGEIAQDLAYYFTQSEQTPSAVSLGVLVDRDYSIKQAGGFIVQMLPNADEETAAKLEEKINKLKPMTEMLEEGKTPEEILDMIAGEFNPKILDKVPVEFYCNCSKERVRSAIASLGANEIQKIIDEDGKADVHCHFCNTDYHFDKEELEEIVKSL